jgi:hypothetical protein
MSRVTTAPGGAMPRTTIDLSSTTAPSAGSRIVSPPVGAVDRGEAPGGALVGVAWALGVGRDVGLAVGEGVGGAVGLGVGGAVGEGVGGSVGGCVGDSAAGTDGVATVGSAEAWAMADAAAVPGGDPEPAAPAGGRGPSNTPAIASTAASAIAPTTTSISQSLESVGGSCLRSSPRGIVPLRCCPGTERAS